MNKRFAIDRVALRLERLRKTGWVIVLCHGCFDLLHPGHIRYLKAATRMNATLVVTVTADRFIHKGPGRPILDAVSRAEMLAALKCVNFVAVSEHPTAVEAINLIKPDVYAKGGEYANAQNKALAEEIEAVEKGGGRIHFIANEITMSSTDILNKYVKAISE